jgi:La domain
MGNGRPARTARPLRVAATESEDPQTPNSVQPLSPHQPPPPASRRRDPAEPSDPLGPAQPDSSAAAQSATSSSQQPVVPAADAGAGGRASAPDRTAGNSKAGVSSRAQGGASNANGAAGGGGRGGARRSYDQQWGGGGRGGGRRGGRDGRGYGRGGMAQQQQYMQQAMAAQVAPQMFYPIASQLYYPAAAYGMPAGVIPGAQPVSKGQLQDAVCRQIEYYFSGQNLCKDIFLRSKMDDGGWIPVAVIAQFNRVRMLTPDLTIIVDALQVCCCPGLLPRTSPCILAPVGPHFMNCVSHPRCCQSLCIRFTSGRRCLFPVAFARCVCEWPLTSLSIPYCSMHAMADHVPLHDRPSGLTWGVGVRARTCRAPRSSRYQMIG